MVTEFSDAELVRRLGLAVKRANTKRATPAAAAEVAALRGELAARLADGRPFDWTTLGITTTAAPRRELGSVYRRSDGKWVAEITIDGQRHRRIVGSERDGRDGIRAISERVEAGVPVRESTMTVGEMGEHVASVVMAARRANTIGAFRDGLTLLGLNDRRLAAVSVADVRAALGAMTARGYSPNTVRVARGALLKTCPWPLMTASSRSTPSSRPRVRGWSASGRRASCRSRRPEPCWPPPSSTPNGVTSSPSCC
jgi:hypothetical protein